MPKITDWRDDLRALLEPKIRAAGITATAKNIKVSDPVIHRWLGGHSSLGEEKLQKLANLFGYEIVFPLIREIPR